MGGPGWSMPVCEMDVRVGGKFRWGWKSDEDGKAFGFHGEFSEVNAPTRLANTEYFDAGDIGGDMGSGAAISNDFAEHDGVHHANHRHPLQEQSRTRSRHVHRHDRRHGAELQKFGHAVSGLRHAPLTLPGPLAHRARAGAHISANSAYVAARGILGPGSRVLRTWSGERETFHPNPARAKYAASTRSAFAADAAAARAMEGTSRRRRRQVLRSSIGR